MPASTISKKKKSPTHLSYIVTASDADHWIGKEDLDAARVHRDAQYVHETGGRVTIDGIQTVVNEERRDRNMMLQLMTYLASPTVKPMDDDADYCTAFTHTSKLTPTAEVDRTCMTFRAPHLNFDTSKLLKQVMAEESRSKGVFAPFAAKHVKKSMRIIPNLKLTTPNGVARNYHVEMVVLTGMGIMVARGFLFLKRDEVESVEKMATHPIKFTDSHINWNTWGFDAERRWVTPWKLGHSGHPFP